MSDDFFDIKWDMSPPKTHECAQCGAHLPEKDADGNPLIYCSTRYGAWFCTDQHQCYERWREKELKR